MLIYKEFREHIDDPGDSERLGRILLKLPLLSQINTNIIEEIFFVGLIGSSTLSFGFFLNELLFCFFRFSRNSENHSVYFEITRHFISC